jgi:hypothetical protein
VIFSKIIDPACALIVVACIVPLASGLPTIGPPCASDGTAITSAQITSAPSTLKLSIVVASRAVELTLPEAR